MPRSFFYVPAMKRSIMAVLLAVSCGFGFISCANQEPEKKPVGPVSESSQIPWNTPVAGQGQGQFGMMPQNQYRR
jgi:hypothetical protein